MRFRFQAAIIGLGLLIASLPVIARTADDAPVKSVLDRQVADWNKGDLDAFCNGYWKSEKLVFQSGGTKSVGWEAMRDRYRKSYQGEGRELGKLKFVDLEIESLGPESSLARGRWELTFSNGKTAGGLFTVIFRKFPEGWRIVHDHTSSDEPKS